jgi:catechol 2,3-dioxygenase-like lactoylglutathione lyase family enzyme
MPNPAKLIAFVTTTNPPQAKAFYQGTLGGVLGLTLKSEDLFAIVFDANGVTLRVAIARQTIPAPYTVLGWEVDDIAATAQALRDRGVRFEIFEGMGQDPLGIWASPSGARVAWFKDPDGNVLSLTQY